MESRTEVVEDDHKKLGFAFSQFLGRLKGVDNEKCEDVAKKLGELFGFDASVSGGRYETDIDLLDVFRSALKEKEKARDGDDDEAKFAQFLTLLEKKGYFKGTEPGTEQYNARVEKARGKFTKHNNPYEGLSAEEVKTKGNEFMSQCKYKDAIACYSKAIELDPENAIYFANRAAAHIHLKNYQDAVLDSERAIALKPNYAKSYSRLGTASFYEGNYTRAVEAYTKACELDPDNSVYKDELKQAMTKKNGSSAVGASGMPGMPGGMPGMPGIPGGMPGMPGMPGGLDFNQLQALASNPQFAQMAQKMMGNPEIAKMMSKMYSGELSQEEMFASMAEGAGVDAQGETVQTPFGAVPRGMMEELQREGLNNPKFAAIREDIQANGIGAMQKYMMDPEVLALMGKMTQLFTGQAGQS